MLLLFLLGGQDDKKTDERNFRNDDRVGTSIFLLHGNITKNSREGWMKHNIS